MKKNGIADEKANFTDRRLAPLSFPGFSANAIVRIEPLGDPREIDCPCELNWLPCEKESADELEQEETHFCRTKYLIFKMVLTFFLAKIKAKNCVLFFI